MAVFDALGAVRACIPGGSIGSPRKRRACEIIQRTRTLFLRTSIQRLYIGYFDDNGDAAFSIAIRTMVQEGENLHFSVGSGITPGSVPARENEETLHKAAGMEMALEAYGDARKLIRQPVKLKVE